MAEARQAIRVLDQKREFEGDALRRSFRDPWYAGFDVNEENGVIRLRCNLPHPRRIIRGMHHYARSSRNLLMYGLFPMPPYVCWTVIFLVMFSVTSSESDSVWRQNVYSRFLWDVDNYVTFSWWKSIVPFDVRVLYLSGIGSLLLMLIIMGTQRLALSCLLSWRVGSAYTILYFAFLCSISHLAHTFIAPITKMTSIGDQQGYLFVLPHETVPMNVRIWALFVKCLKGSSVRRLMYSYQLALPKLPLPHLEETCETFLRSMKELVTPSEYRNLVRAAKRFVEVEGPPLQRFLSLRRLWCSNYVSSWWETFVYLRNRRPLLLNSNYYICDGLERPPTSSQTARAASLITAMVSFRELIVTEKLSPLLLKDMVPICMQQYERIFNTTRIPGRQIDKICHRTYARHIVVTCRRLFWRLDVQHWDGTPFSPWHIQKQLERIRRDADLRWERIRAKTKSDMRRKSQSLDDQTHESDDSETSCGEKKNVVRLRFDREGTEWRKIEEDDDEDVPAIAALTSMNRTAWADLRERYFSDTTNRQSLDAIEKAAFVLVLDDSRDVHTWSSRSKSLLHGDGSNRWCDKSLNLVVFPDGHAGLHVEHTCADALVPAHMWEWCVAHELRPCSGLRFGPDGRIRAPKDGSRGIFTSSVPPPPKRHRASLSNMRRSASYAEFVNRLVESQSSSMTPSVTSPETSPRSSPPRSRKTPRSSSQHENAASTDDVLSSAACCLNRERVGGDKNATSVRRLPFDLNDDARRIVANARRDARRRIEDIAVNVFHVSELRKATLKSKRVSPDAFVQIALQVAYFRDQNTFSLTYEACATRIFREGRTETVRVVTKDSCAFVRALCEDQDEGVGSHGDVVPSWTATRREHLAVLLRRACDTHRNGYVRCVNGRGADRHMFALYVASRTIQVDRETPELLKLALSQKWRLSTSQQPQVQAPRQRALVPDELKKYTVSPGGGFGPVADDGYGVSYMFVDMHGRVYFHVSAKRSASKTDTRRFEANLRWAFAALKAILLVR